MSNLSIFFIELNIEEIGNLFWISYLDLFVELIDELRIWIDIMN